jgi:hypothetical protein
VRLRDRLDDGEPEADALSGSGTVASSESLERVCRELGRESRTFVGDVDHGAAERGPGDQGDRSSSVAQGVLDEIPECLTQSHGIGMHQEPWCDVDPNDAASSRRAVSEPVPHATY